MPRPPGGIECLVQNPVERELLQLLERLRFAQLTVDDGLAGLAVLVDDPVRAPGQIVIQGIGWEFRQGADTHPHVVQLIETRGQVAGHDGDEAGRQAALGNESRARARRELLHRAGAGDVLGQIQVMGAGRLGRFGDQPGGVIGRRAQHGELAHENLPQRIPLSDVGDHFGDIRRRFEPVELMLRPVHHRHGVVSGPAEQLGDHRANFSGAYDDDVLHDNL